MKNQIFNRKLVSAVLLIPLLQSQVALADWHGGTITGIHIGYEGELTFSLSGWSRTNCTCYPTWPTYMCLSRSRSSFKEDYAWLLKARALGETVSIQIDETSCAVLALSEGT